MRRFHLGCTIFAAAIFLCPFVMQKAEAEDREAISVSGVTVFPTRLSDDIAHLSLTISNSGAEPDVLLFVEVPTGVAAAAGMADLASSVSRGGGLIRMSQPVFLKAGDSRTFAPGDLHPVLYGLRRPLIGDQEFPITLSFQNAGNISARVRVSAEDVRSPFFEGFQDGPGALDWKRFKCANGPDLLASFVIKDNVLTAIVDAGEGAHALPLQHWAGGEPKMTWTDGSRTLVWSTGVHLMWMEGAKHLSCGGGGHSH